MADMEEIIKKEIGRIGNLRERVAFKDVVEQIFLSLYETNKEMYQELESRVMSDLALDLNRCRIITGVAEREYVDLSHHLLSPMDERERGKEDYVKTFFMECDYLKILELLQKERAEGTVRTRRGVYPASFAIKKNAAYMDEIARLYEVFIGNGIPWQTVNVPYLDKFIDLRLTDMPKGVGAAEEIISADPDLGEFAQYAHSNYVPIWNVKKLILNSVGFPVPCEDHRSYEHTISIKEYGEEHVYLVDDRTGIYSVRQEGNRLTIMGGEEEARKWQVYMIRCGQNRRFERFIYPLMTNLRKDEFLERFGRQGRRVRTKAELARFIKGYGLEEYVAYEGCELKDKSGEASETYSMNGFILDEIRERDYKKCLVLKFRGRGEQRFLLRDIMSFLVSEVQLLYGEYRCEGVLL